MVFVSLYSFTIQKRQKYVNVKVLNESSYSCFFGVVSSISSWNEVISVNNSGPQASGCSKQFETWCLV